MSIAVKREILELWCEAVRLVLRRRRIYATESEVRGALLEGLSADETIAKIEANLSVVARFRGRALAVWSSWVQR